MSTHGFSGRAARTLQRRRSEISDWHR